MSAPRSVASARGPPASSNKSASSPSSNAETVTRDPGPKTVLLPKESRGETVRVTSSPATAVRTSLSGDASCAPYTDVTDAFAAAAPGYATSSNGEPGIGS